MVRGVRTVSDNEIISVIDNIEGPAATASEVAAKVDMSKEGIYNRLEQLEQSGELNRKQPQPTTVIWWLPENEASCVDDD